MNSPSQKGHQQNCQAGIFALHKQHQVGTGVRAPWATFDAGAMPLDARPAKAPAHGLWLEEVVSSAYFVEKKRDLTWDGSHVTWDGSHFYLGWITCYYPNLVKNYRKIIKFSKVSAGIWILVRFRGSYTSGFFTENIHLFKGNLSSTVEV